MRASIALVFVLAGPVMGLATSTRFRDHRLEMHGFSVPPPPVNPEDLYEEPGEVIPDSAAERSGEITGGAGEPPQ